MISVQVTVVICKPVAHLGKIHLKLTSFTTLVNSFSRFMLVSIIIGLFDRFSNELGKCCHAGEK